ncbi:hypothetical protein CLOM_g11101, partial [Closterium sp. NIES-68]
LPPGLPPERPQDHRIKLEPSAQPTVRTQWRLMQPELQELRDQQDYLLVKGFVRPSTSSFAALIFFTPKKDGGLRMCIDYRALNRVTINSEGTATVLLLAGHDFGHAEVRGRVCDLSDDEIIMPAASRTVAAPRTTPVTLATRDNGFCHRLAGRTTWKRRGSCRRRPPHEDGSLCAMSYDDHSRRNRASVHLGRRSPAWYPYGDHQRQRPKIHLALLARHVEPIRHSPTLLIVRIKDGV